MHEFQSFVKLLLITDAANIKLSKTQLSKKIQLGRFIANLLVDPALRLRQRNTQIFAIFVNKEINNLRKNDCSN